MDPVPIYKIPTQALMFVNDVNPASSLAGESGRLANLPPALSTPVIMSKTRGVNTTSLISE